jgi:hypothetical protein
MIFSSRVICARSLFARIERARTAGGQRSEQQTRRYDRKLWHREWSWSYL